MTSFIQSKEAPTAANGFPPVKIIPPTQMLVKSEKKTRRVDMARPIATRGGTTDKKLDMRGLLSDTNYARGFIWLWG